ncbi:WYL domain-containing protein [Treponema bryantii]|uniref:WYL domain-containing protein n=1 Tax=Treponema bryantii TaxID=163 RepID=UPI0003B5827B|nr:WYL domain-containing protein [Treponema bryantii]
MLFSEIYSAYYNTVASIISCSQQGKLDSDLLFKIVKESAFPESFMTIGSALETGKWPLIKKDYSTNIQNIPTMPLSVLQKRWLKALCNDKRIRLFVSDEVLECLKNQLQDVEVLFNENDYYLYDKYSDGDPYDDPDYIKNFRTALEAIHQKKTISVEYTGRFGQQKRFICAPYKIEYSEKDDKFRIISKVRNRHSILNIARINSCELTENSKVDDLSEDDLPDNRRTSVTLEIYDERKAMERVMLAFAHFEKSAVQISDDVYRLTLNYDSFDETELVVRVLSFGPMVKVLEPESFRNLIQERISKQIELMNN